MTAGLLGKMQRRKLWSWLVAILIISELFALGGAQAQGENQVALVVQFPDGSYDTRCLSLREGMSGAELLVESGLDVVWDNSSSVGAAVCMIEKQGCAFPSDPCFCGCLGGGDCSYWNYFFRNGDDVEWTYSALGATARRVRAGSVEAWVWGDGKTPPAVSSPFLLTFESICVPPTTVPTSTATSRPTLAPDTSTPNRSTVRPTQTQIPKPLSTPISQTVTASPPMPEAASESFAWSTYGLFGLMLFGLAVVGGIVWWQRTRS